MSNREVVREKMVGAAPETERDGAPEAAPRRLKTTLGERGPLLPVGFDVGGALVKGFVTKSWKTKDERELAKLKKPRMSMATYIGNVLGQMLSQFGPHSFSPEAKMAERLVGIGQAYMGDVFYAYMYLRTQVIGSELKMDVTCPTPDCGNFRFVGDLGSTEVICVEEASALDWFHDLRDPIELRKKTVTKFRLRSPLWHSLVSTAAGDFSEMAGKIMAVQSSIVGLNDDGAMIAISDAEMDEVSKFDLESIAARVNDEFVGPKMAIEGKCPKCEREFKAPIDWSYDRFFTTSSL
jgi:hypothetical protein